ncbi:ABC transporter permease subunit [Streptomyces sp. NPDC006622]|uniref:ABC transporter permease subunit n=1 Tax=Streptomyces sp. NPDC006622 TaxID=3155459 RepID=UPI0033A59C0B
MSTHAPEAPRRTGASPKASTRWWRFFLLAHFTAVSLLLFVIQALPVVVFVVPLFILFADLGLADSIAGLTIVYVASTMSVACWMMASYMDSIPASVKEAAWIDGCSVFGGFVKTVLRNSLPGVLSTAIFSFLLVWNDYLVPQQNTTDW